MSVFSSSVGLSLRVLTDGWRHKNWVNSRDKGMSDLLTAWPLPPCSSGRSCKVGWLVLMKLSQKICLPKVGRFAFANCGSGFDVNRLRDQSVAGHLPSCSFCKAGRSFNLQRPCWIKMLLGSAHYSFPAGEVVWCEVKKRNGSTLRRPPKNPVDQIQFQYQMSPSTQVKNCQTLHPSRAGNTTTDINMDSKADGKKKSM